MDKSSTVDQPPPKDLSQHYSRLVKRTQPSAIKKFYKYFSIPNIGNLAGGLPNPDYFPYDTLESRIALPDRFRPTPNHPVQPPVSSPKDDKKRDSRPEFHLVVPHDSSEESKVNKIDLATGLQYGTAIGYPPLYTWVRNTTRNILQHEVPYKGGPEIILTCGNTDGFAKVLQAFSDMWDSDKDWLRERQGVLCEEFAYMNAIQAIRPRGLNVVPVVIDSQGMTVEGPGGLRDVLENWDKSKGRIPHLMYTVTMGQNPTSGLLSLPRRKAIYSLCQKFDIIIVEDDPYWFLQYPSANELSVKYRGKSIVPNYEVDYAVNESRPSSGSPFLDSLVPSYLSIDVDGRVIRLDTFSKTVAPGCRLGWATAQPEFVDRLLRITDVTTQQPCGFVQSMIAELILGPHPKLDASVSSAEQTRDPKHMGWQAQGWIRWLEGLRGNYERRMQLMSQIFEEGKYKVTHEAPTPRKSLCSNTEDDYEVLNKTQLFDFDFPMAGMFLWLRVHFENHPLFKHPKVPNERLAQALWVFLTGPKYRVLVGPGTIFCPTDDIRTEKGWMYYRLCFAAVSEDVIDATSHKFVEGTGEFFDINTPEEIDEILKDDDEEAILERVGMLSIQARDQWMVSPIMC